MSPRQNGSTRSANIGGYCHLSTGQEPATVGAVAPLHAEDYLVMSYRTHGLALARGTPPEAVMAELFGRSGGCARGRGGSMHLLDVGRNMLGGWGIVCGQVPIATGVALALVQQGRRQAVLCELGDGAVNMGAWHESLNIAGAWGLPIVYLVMNNEYGMGTAVERASPSRSCTSAPARSGCTASVWTATTSRPCSRPPSGCWPARETSAGRPCWRP